MKKSTYTRTALASLLALCSFSSFAADFPNESIKEVKKQESTESGTTSRKMEVMKTSNKRLKEKMDRICNADPRKKAEQLKKEEPKKEEELKLIAEKKKDRTKLASKKNTKLVKDSKAKAQKVRDSSVKSSKAQNAKIEAKDVKKNVKVVSQNVKEKGKASPVISVGGVDIIDTNQGKSDLRITFGGVVDTQSYGKVGSQNDNYKRFNVMADRFIAYYDSPSDTIKGANPIFPEGIGNIGDYSDSMGMVADAILHLRAENKNENLGLLYGADVQFHVPVTEGKGASQGVYAARGRSAHIFINSEYGDIKLGYQFGPEALMRLDATRIATVDGAADSDWFRKVNLEGNTAIFPFYVTPRLYTESFSSESEKLSFRMAGKYDKAVISTLPFRIAYYSPKYMGARFGFAYSPRYDSNLFIVKDTVENKEMLRHVGPDYEHILSAGASYEYDLYEYKIKVKAAAVGEYGQPKQPNKDKHIYDEYVEYNDLMGINLGVNADYKVDEDQSVKFGASFAYLGKSGQPKGIKRLNNNEYEVITNQDRIKGLEQFNDDGNNTMYWTAGAGYQRENIYTSLTYFGSKMNDGDMLHDIALGVQYDLSPACSKSKFVPYLAAHYFWTKEEGNNIKLRGKKTAPEPNQGALILTGVKFSF